jgi:hypothetical protein
LCLVSGLIFGLLTYTRTWLIQTHMEQKPLRWVAAGAYAVRKRPECAGMVYRLWNVLINTLFFLCLPLRRRLGF